MFERIWPPSSHKIDTVCSNFMGVTQAAVHLAFQKYLVQIPAILTEVIHDFFITVL
jgi:hypothetical protein